MNHNCCYEERFTRLEQEVTELKTQMNNKKETLDTLNKQLFTDRQQQMELIEKVTEVTVLLKEGQKQREDNNKKFEALERKVDKLQEEFTDFSASQRSFRNTVIVGVPIMISIIVGIIFHFV